MFFGALLSAIMSTASGTLLAPSITLTENVLREFIPMNDRQTLLTARIVVVCFAIAVTAFALASQGTSIYDMVGNAYKVTLVSAFVPLVMGLYWARATTQGALLSVFGGLGSWLLMEQFGGDSIWPPQLVGLLVSFGGMLVGSLAPQFVSKPATA
jgi:Na+/proline symporter